MTENFGKQRSQRQLKVGETLRHALSDIFMREDFYGPGGESVSITISEVQISPDLHNATVFYMPLGGKDKESTQNLLHDLSPKIRSYVSKKVHMRHVPSLYFKLDTTFENAARMNSLLEEQRDE